MKEIILPKDGGEQFLRNAQIDGYSMADDFIKPETGAKISAELEQAGLLVDLTELEPTSQLNARTMPYTTLLFNGLHQTIANIERTKKKLHLIYFSVRVFDSGEHGTTVHRNHPSVGPWAVGITLRGKAPFNVYDQDQLPDDQVIPLRGTNQDPEPKASMNACAGSAWTLYTEHQLVPHSSGLVKSKRKRELLLFYGMNW